ncbi:iron-sulfur cluster assembly protein [Nonomuraea sp. NPDC026600]|uniref:iron-sulfur cluster assembly protein n=1 Tax=Nonomuraea sp. NPDC026600 TaxID=3155363 RepID=UPI0033F2DB6C
MTTRATPSEETIRAQLSKIPEPCGILMRSPLDICQMGLVDKVECADGRVRIELVLTDSSCVHFTGLRRYIVDVLRELPGVETVEVVASTTTLWTPDRLRRPGSA